MFKNLVIGLIFAAGAFFPSLSSKSVATPLLKVQNPSAYPQAGENGDYGIVNGNSGYMPWEWEVVDPDPNGLNCRLEDRGKTRGNDIYNFPIAYTIKPGDRFNGVGISTDDRGLPWIWVGTSFSRTRCWVRANTKYVRPVRKINQNL